jgi:DNA repair exonuclease SbcCD nuclease subunit
VGDVHLDKGTSIGKNYGPGKLNSRNEDKFRLLKWVQSKAIEYNVKNVIFTGDIFESYNVDNVLVQLFFSYLKSYEQYDINVHIILGNHDIKRIGSEYHSVLNLINIVELPKCKVYSEIFTQEVEDGFITFIPFRDRKSLNAETNAAALDKLSELLPSKTSFPHICVGHLTLEGSLYVGDEIDDLHNELHCSSEMFSSRFNATFMGHIHKPQIRNESPLVCHVGSLDISDFGEMNHDKIVYIYDSSRENPIKLDVPTRNLRKLEVIIPEEVDPTQYLIDVLSNEEDKKSFYDSILNLELKFQDPKQKIDVKKINQTLEKYSVHNLTGIIESRAKSVVSTDKRNSLTSSVSPKDAFKDWLDSRELTDDRKSKIIQLANDIIDEAMSK